MGRDGQLCKTRGLHSTPHGTLTLDTKPHQSMPPGLRGWDLRGVNNTHSALKLFNICNEKENCCCPSILIYIYIYFFYPLKRLGSSEKNGLHLQWRCMAELYLRDECPKVKHEITGFRSLCNIPSIYSCVDNLDGWLHRIRRGFNLILSCRALSMKAKVGKCFLLRQKCNKLLQHMYMHATTAWLYPILQNQVRINNIQM